LFLGLEIIPGTLVLLVARKGFSINSFGTRSTDAFSQLEVIVKHTVHLPSLDHKQDTEMKIRLDSRCLGH
jgi:hypothetical protein